MAKGAGPEGVQSVLLRVQRVVQRRGRARKRNARRTYETRPDTVGLFSGRDRLPRCQKRTRILTAPSSRLNYDYMEHNRPLGNQCN